MDKWVGSVAFVTGASAGIGEAIAEKFVQQGINVVGMARRKEKLDAIAKRLSSKKIFCGSGKKSKKGKFYGFPGDVTKEEDIIKAFKWTYERVGPISILVNNAGVLVAGPLSSTPTKDWKNALDINVVALSIATREALTQMKENNINGHIFHMNAIAGHKVRKADNIGFYAANKYATTALAESLRLELAKSGSQIKITARDDAEIETALTTALELGYRHIDTAFYYENERAVGRVLTKWINSGKLRREELFVTTKLIIKGNHRDRVEKYIKQSLANLGMDYVDLYLVHFPVGLAETDDFIKFEPQFEPHDHKGLWKSMEAQVAAGRAKTIGISNFNLSQVDNLLQFAKIKPACNQVELHVFLQQPELVKFCQSHGIVVVAYSPIANPGYNKFLKRVGADERKDLVNVLTHPVISEIAKKHNKTNPQIALRFLVQKNIVVIPKSVTPARLKENFDLFGFSLDDTDLRKLEALNIGEPARVCDWKLIPKITEHPDYPFGK